MGGSGPSRAGEDERDAVRIVGRLLAGLLMVVLGVGLVGTVAVGGLLTWVNGRAQPQLSGSLRAPGLAAPVEVIRDETGIAHLYADTPDDLFLAQGGNPGGRHFSDLVDDWITGRTVPLSFTRDAVEARASTRLVLEP